MIRDINTEFILLGPVKAQYEIVANQTIKAKKNVHNDDLYMIYTSSNTLIPFKKIEFEK